MNDRNNVGAEFMDLMTRVHQETVIPVNTKLVESKKKPRRGRRKNESRMSAEEQLDSAMSEFFDTVLEELLDQDFSREEALKTARTELDSFVQGFWEQVDDAEKTGGYFESKKKPRGRRKNEGFRVSDAEEDLDKAMGSFVQAIYDEMETEGRSPEEALKVAFNELDLFVRGYKEGWEQNESKKPRGRKINESRRLIREQQEDVCQALADAISPKAKLNVSSWSASRIFRGTQEYKQLVSVLPEGVVPAEKLYKVELYLVSNGTDDQLSKVDETTLKQTVGPVSFNLRQDGSELSGYAWYGTAEQMPAEVPALNTPAPTIESKKTDAERIRENLKK